MHQKMATGICPLETALDYRNDMVIYKFLESFDLSFAEAEDLFQEMLRFLWLTAKHQIEQPPNCPRIFTHEPLILLDEMRHTFMLFSQDYADYCMQNFGFFVHHWPTTETERRRQIEAFEQDQEEALAIRKRQLLALYRYIYDTLGEETLRKWYQEYPQKYPRHVINLIFRKWSDRSQSEPY